MPGRVPAVRRCGKLQLCGGARLSPVAAQGRAVFLISGIAPLILKIADSHEEPPPQFRGVRIVGPELGAAFEPLQRLLQNLEKGRNRKHKANDQLANYEMPARSEMSISDRARLRYFACCLPRFRPRSKMGPVVP